MKQRTRKPIPTIPEEHIQIWQGTDGDYTRPLAYYKPCPCGCDYRSLPAGVIGYVSGGNGKDKGVTIYITRRSQTAQALTIAAALLINPSPH